MLQLRIVQANILTLRPLVCVCGTTMAIVFLMRQVSFVRLTISLCGVVLMERLTLQLSAYRLVISPRLNLRYIQ